MQVSSRPQSGAADAASRQEGNASLASGAEAGCCNRRVWGSLTVRYAAGAVQDTTSTIAQAVGDIYAAIQSLRPDLYNKMLERSQAADRSTTVQGTEGMGSNLCRLLTPAAQPSTPGEGRGRGLLSRYVLAPECQRCGSLACRSPAGLQYRGNLRSFALFRGSSSVRDSRI